MSYDLLIKNGTIVDGSGAARFDGDVAVRGGKIAALGKIDGAACGVLPVSVPISGGYGRCSIPSLANTTRCAMRSRRRAAA